MVQQRRKLRAITEITGGSGVGGQTQDVIGEQHGLSMLWLTSHGTARPPARPVLGAEATMAQPAGLMTFRCPPAVRSTRRLGTLDVRQAADELTASNLEDGVAIVLERIVAKQSPADG